MSTGDQTLERIKGAFRLFCRAERVEGRRQLEQIWQELEPDGDVFCRCLTAHYLADTEDEPAAELDWDRRALEVAESIGDNPEHPATAAVRAFIPSLHLNLADDYRRLGDFDRAQRHVELGYDNGQGLGLDAYGQNVRAALVRVSAQIDERDSGPPVVFDFD